MTSRTPAIALAAALSATLLVACGSDADADTATETDTATDSDVQTAESEPSESLEPSEPEPAETSAAVDVDNADATAVISTYEIEVWADNWMAVYVDGTLIGEDTVPITTERSFNAETFRFEATAPFTLAIEAKDFKETDSGIEYIGQQNQQMGDGGLIAQVTDVATGEVVAVTDASWSTLVIHQAPLNTECERDPDPDATCEFISLDAPDGWADTDFDDSGWSSATVWSAADVSPKDGYDEISWDPSAQLVWGTDLEVDNTILLRTQVSS